MIVLEKYGFSFCSHRRFPLLSITLRDVISFILDQSYNVLGSFYNASDPRSSDQPA